MDLLVGAGSVRDYARGEVVFHQGDPGDALYLLRCGRVAVRVVTLQGDEVTLALLAAPDAFGEMGLIRPDHHHSATVVALDPVRVVVVPAGRFHELRRTRPELTDWLLDVLVRRLERSTDLLADAYFLDADQRVARRLLDCVLEPWADDVHEVPLTQADLAAMAGVTRPTANRVLRALERAGTVHLHRRHIDVVDLRSLRRVAG